MADHDPFYYAVSSFIAGQEANPDLAALMQPYLANEEKRAYAMGVTAMRDGKVLEQNVGTVPQDGIGPDRIDIKTIQGDQNRPLASGDVFPVASVTKTFVAAIIVQLSHEGTLSLDDKLADKADVWKAALARRYPEADAEKLNLFASLLKEKTGPDATLADLLQHKSGLAGNGKQLGVDRGPRVFANFETAPTQENGALSFLRPDEGQLIVPRGNYDYSNAGYVLAQLIAEAASGESFRELNEKHLIKPMGLQNTRVTFAPDDVPNGAGCMCSTREDLLKFMTEIARNPAYAKMVSDNIGVQAVEIGGQKFVGHSGGGGNVEIAAFVALDNPKKGFATVKTTLAEPLQPSLDVQSGSVEVSSKAPATKRGV